MNKKKLIYGIILFLPFSAYSIRNKRKNIPQVKSVMVFAPHPDDDILGCGGVLTKHRNDGASCSIVYVTSGEAPKGKKDRETFARQREEEARKGAEQLGVTNLVYMKEPDGKLKLSDDTIETVVGILKKHKPQLVYIPHALDDHPDHRSTYTIVVEAVKRLKERPMVLAYEVWTPLQVITHTAPLTKEEMNLKLEALSEHTSQVKSINFADAISSLNRYRGILMCRASYAECFRLIEEEDEHYS